MEHGSKRNKEAQRENHLWPNVENVITLGALYSTGHYFLIKTLQASLHLHLRDFILRSPSWKLSFG